MFSDVFYSDGLSLALRQGAFGQEFHTGRDEDFVFEPSGDLTGEFLQPAVVVGEELAELYFYRHLVVAFARFEGDEVVGGEFFKLQENGFNLYESNLLELTGLENLQIAGADSL